MRGCRKGKKYRYIHLDLLRNEKYGGALFIGESALAESSLAVLKSLQATLKRNRLSSVESKRMTLQEI